VLAFLVLLFPFHLFCDILVVGTTALCHDYHHHQHHHHHRSITIAAMADFKVKDDLDSNAWYQLTEERVDNYDSASFGSSLTVDTGKGTLSMQAANKNYYQFLPVDNKKGRYAIRNSMTGIRKQLSVCYVDDEIADGKTQPCFVTSDGSDEQKWDVADWGNKTYSFLKLENVRNGTSYYLEYDLFLDSHLSCPTQTNL
jgi:hypothetical protein